MVCNWLYREMTTMDISKMDYLFQLMTEEVNKSFRLILIKIFSNGESYSKDLHLIRFLDIKNI